MKSVTSLLFVFLISAFFHPCTVSAQAVPAKPAPAVVSIPVPAPVVTPTPAPTPASAVAAPAATPNLSGGFIAIVLGIIGCANIVLSAVQQIFSKLSKSEPGWLQTVSSVVLAVTKYLGSNPNV